MSMDYFKFKTIANIPFTYLKFKINPEWVRPKIACLLVTENCFFKCQTCLYWRKKSKDLSKEKIFEIIDQCKDFGIKQMVLTGGEPLFRKDLIEIADYITKNGMTVYLITNGWLLDDETIKHFVGINVSLDGINPETHDKIRNTSGAYKRAIKALEKIKKAGVSCSVNFVVQKENYLQIVDIFDLIWKTFGYKVRYHFYSMDGMGQPSDKTLRRMDLNLLQSKINELVNKYNHQINYLPYFNLVINKMKNGCNKQTCIVPYHKIMISGNGDIYPCSAYTKPIGNIFENSLEKIWNNNKPLREKILKGTDETCKKCVSCELTLNTHRDLIKCADLLLMRVKIK